MRLLSYLNNQIFCWNDLPNAGTSDVWKHLNDKKFVQILPLHENHYVVITNLKLSTEETKKLSTFLILALSFPTVKWKTNKIFNIFHQNLLQLSTKNAKKNCQANLLPSSGYYAITCAYILFRNLHIFSLNISQENISSNIISLFETNEIPSFQCLPLLHETKTDVSMDSQETLYCNFRSPDLGKSVKQCSLCLDWFHEHCESFD